VHWTALAAPRTITIVDNGTFKTEAETGMKVCSKN
jgi:hypothetical protein